jgi:hypothetical protein
MVGRLKFEDDVKCEVEDCFWAFWIPTDFRMFYFEFLDSNGLGVLSPIFNSAKTLEVKL